MYLFAAGCLTACFLVGWAMSPSLRGSSLLSAVVLAPFAFLGVVFVPAYWQPDHWVTFVRGVGIEDVLFCFGCGGVVWIIAASGSGARWHGPLEPRAFLTRFACWAAIALVAVFTAWWAGCGILAAVIVGFTVSGLAALCHAPHAGRLMLPGAIGFTVLYAAVGWFVLAMHPNSAGFWVGDAISGCRVLALPVEELVWSCSFGAIWPVVFAYCLGDGLIIPTRPATAS